MMINIKQIKGLFKELQELWTAIKDKANSNDLHKVATSGSYNDLKEKPTLPVVPKISKVGLSGKYEDLENKPEIPTLPDLHKVATSGSYDDLEGKPKIPVVPNISKAGLSGKYEDLENKPEIPTLPNLHKVATSGSYNDLEDKPKIEIPTIDKTSLELDKVNNTRDEDKPVSKATQKELDKKHDNTFILLKQNTEQFTIKPMTTEKILFDTVASIKGNISMSGNGILIQEEGVYQLFLSLYKYGPWGPYTKPKTKIYKNGVFLISYDYYYRIAPGSSGPTINYDITSEAPYYNTFLELSKNDVIEIFAIMENVTTTVATFDRTKTFLFAKKIS